MAPRYEAVLKTTLTASTGLLRRERIEVPDAGESSEVAVGRRRRAAVRDDPRLAQPALDEVDRLIGGQRPSHHPGPCGYEARAIGSSTVNVVRIGPR